MSGGAVALQCAASMAGTLVGETLGSTLTAKLAAGVLGALIGAFLTAPGRHRRRRIVAVALLLALLDALRRAAGAMAAERRRPPGAWVPANWAVVGVAAVAGFAGGSAVTTVRGAWAEERAIVAVPEVRGEPRAAALAILADTGLDATAAGEPSEEVPEGAATRTDPPAGSGVEEDAEVTLFVSSGPPGATVTVPDVTGQERRAALDILQDVGLRPRTETEASPTIARGFATRTDPRAGTEVDDGARITLLVSSGPVEQPVEIPDVRGRPRDDALAVLRDAGLRPTATTEASEDVEEGAATRTDPEAGSEVDRGTPVTVFVSSGPAVGPVQVPDVVGSTREEAFAALEDAGLEPEGATEPSDAVAEGAVVRTDPAAGTEVDEGSAVTVVVSTGPPPLVVPRLVRLQADVAEARLKQVGLGAERQVVGSGTPMGTVVGTDPTAGTVVERGDVVTLRVSCGSEFCVD